MYKRKTVIPILIAILALSGCSQPQPIPEIVTTTATEKETIVLSDVPEQMGIYVEEAPTQPEEETIDENDYFTGPGMEANETGTDLFTINELLGIDFDLSALHEKINIILLSQEVAKYEVLTDVKNPVYLYASKNKDRFENFFDVAENPTLTDKNPITYQNGKTVINQYHQEGFDIYKWKIEDIGFMMISPDTTDINQRENILNEAVKASFVNAANIEAVGEYGQRWYSVSDDGSSLDVSLQETDGYKWSCAINDASLIQLVSQYEEDDVWHASFEVAAPGNGKTTISFACKRPWNDKADKTLTLNVVNEGGRIGVSGYGESKRTFAIMPDGEYEVRMLDSNMTVFEDYTEIAADIMSNIVLNDDDLNALSLPSEIQLNQYGKNNIEVYSFDEIDENTIDIGDGIHLLQRTDEGYVIIGINGEIESVVMDSYTITVDENTEIYDEMSEIAYDDIDYFGTIEDILKEYQNVRATVKVKDGKAKKIIVHYRP